MTEFAVDISKPPIAPPNRTMRDCCDETPDSVRRQADYRNYLDRYRAAIDECSRHRRASAAAEATSGVAEATFGVASLPRWRCHACQGNECDDGPCEARTATRTSCCLHTLCFSPKTKPRGRPAESPWQPIDTIVQ